MPRLPAFLKRIKILPAIKRIWRGKSKVNDKQDFFDKASAELNSSNRRQRRAAVIALAEYGKSKFGSKHAERIFSMLRPLALEEDLIVQRAALLGLADISHKLSGRTRRNARTIISKALHSADFRLARTANAALYYFENPPAAGVRPVRKAVKVPTVARRV
ncbi:MAG: hypothetical protein AABW72_06010 [archaeon]